MKSISILTILLGLGLQVSLANPTYKDSSLKPTDVVLVQSSKCNSIRNADRKKMCQATTSGRDSYCNSIRNIDTKFFCRAIVKGRESYCNSITNRDTKAECKAQF